MGRAVVSGNKKATKTPTEGDCERKPDNRPREPKLRDKIPKDVHTLFVGINPGRRSAEIGHYYGGNGNQFWKLLTLAGIWPTPLTPYDDDKLAKSGFGFTDVVKR